MPVLANLSAWSISGVSGNNTTSSVFNKSQSLIQSFERVSLKINIYIVHKIN